MTEPDSTDPMVIQEVFRAAVRKAIQESFAAGHWISYVDDQYGGAIIREYPDGRRVLLGPGGKPVRDLPPR